MSCGFELCEHLDNDQRFDRVPWLGCPDVAVQLNLTRGRPVEGNDLDC
ncbi:hypothetical protein I553_4114 [Mycobacterium xenopi 4042]|uniref:Uncharacterized protein n=1 Tax=Mycobacterium xenopi 4042 TaxID=1299334 RepID=X8AFD4_MYCXE|nr:hypothetical protein I553_4114 [Mycobacterium xenopi 4042]EUA50551.1 hypothetical protein I552_1487 [Mycobacterium xenopi 3993]